MIDVVDVLIVGAGPAGATTALNLAPTRSVGVVDIAASPGRRIGESLIPSARRLLDDMGILEMFLAQGHAPSFAVRSVWGSTQVVDVDSLRDPHGPGWHLNRKDFDRLLLDEAVRRGARFIAPARVVTVDRHDTIWRVGLVDTITSIERTVETRLLIDATGRRSAVARRLGANRVVTDRLIARSIIGRDRRVVGSGVSDIVTDPDGWWYTASLTDGERVIVFHVDADLPGARRDLSAVELLASARAHPLLRRALESFDVGCDPRPRTASAASMHLDQVAGVGWLAVGDAAMAFDPVSSQGIYNALFTGLAAAVTADRYLGREFWALDDYTRSLAAVWRQYRGHLTAYYRLEQRWAAHPFWSRRHAGSR